MDVVVFLCVASICLLINKIKVTSETLLVVT